MLQLKVYTNLSYPPKQVSYLLKVHVDTNTCVISIGRYTTSHSCFSLTVEEHLEFFATIKGVPASKMKIVVSKYVLNSKMKIVVSKYVLNSN